MLWFQVETNYRSFTLEAAGIGDAIDRALQFIEAGRGEYLRTVEPSLVVPQVAA